MKSTERRLKLMLLLQSGAESMNANDIAERFGVSRRTVFRDLRFLENIDVPIAWDRQRGYYIVRGYKVPPLMFTEKEVATILIGLSFVKSQIDETLVEDAEGVELKIKNVLPPELNEFMNRLGERTVVDPYLQYGGQKKKGGNWYSIGSAIAEQKRLLFRYYSRKDEILTLRKLDPYLLVYFQDHWNVIGYSHKRNALRNFVLDRISHIQVTNESFESPGDFDIYELIYGTDEDGYLIEIAVSSDIQAHFNSQLPAPVERESSLNDKWSKIRFRFDNLDYINRWLLQFADNVKVMQPQTLINRRKNLLTGMLNTIG